MKNKSIIVETDFDNDKTSVETNYSIRQTVFILTEGLAMLISKAVKNKEMSFKDIVKGLNKQLKDAFKDYSKRMGEV